MTPRAEAPAVPAPGFLRANAPWLGAGVALTFASSFGQTFFIGLFAGEIRASYGLSHGAWGGAYTLGTLAAAAAMLVAGGLADRLAPRRLATIMLLALAAACLGMAALPGAWALPLAIFGLRFCGQGMMGHIALVTAGRWFRASRGRAVSIVSAGHSLGEAMLPLPFVLLIAAAGWRAGWVAAAMLVLVLVPVLGHLLRRERQPAGTETAGPQPGLAGRHWTRRAMLGHWLFWVCFPAFLAQPVFGTALFFQQVHLTEAKGWPLELFVGLYPVFVGATLLGLFAAGWAIDRFGAGRVLPVNMLPLAGAFVLFSQGATLASAAAAFLLFGLAQGASATTAGAFWPEHYGSRHLGSIRAVATSLMVFATAISPALTGLLIDAGIALERQFLAMAAYAAVMGVVLLAAMARARRGA